MRMLLSALLTVCLTASGLVGASERNVPEGDPVRASGLFHSATGSQTGLNNQVTAVFTLTGTDNDGGGNDDVSLQIFDDSSLVGSTTVLVPVGETQSFTRTIDWTGPIGVGAPGVGLVLIDVPGTETLSLIDPFFLDGELPLSLTKAAPTMVATGEQLTYTITFGNQTPTPYNNVVIRDTIPIGTTFASATAGGMLSGNRVEWTIGTLAAGTIGQSVQFTVNVNATQGTIVNRTYSIAADGVPAVDGAPTTTVVFGAAPIPAEPVPSMGLKGLLVLLGALVTIGLGMIRRS